MVPLPVPATAQDSVRVATVAWRARGKLYLTVVAKATFTLVPEGRMTLVEPDPIVDREVPEPFGKGGLSAGGDLAPYLGKAEILLTGHAQVSPTSLQLHAKVQLAVVQNGALRLDKQLELPVTETGGGALRIGGMGPVSRTWPQRRRWLDGIDASGLERPLLEIPDALHWEYFQTAPPDQRLDGLAGDEWLMLGGMLRKVPRLRTQLPEGQAVARIFRTTQAPPRHGETVVLHADTLQVDMDRRRCSILWRGRAELWSEEELAALHVGAAFAQPGKAITWSDPIAASYVLDEESSLASDEPRTVPLGPDASKQPKSPAAPLTPAESAPVHGGTVYLWPGEPKPPRDRSRS
jgi:hypothetical protein